MLTLIQDSNGFIRMNRPFPESLRLTIQFTDGSTEDVLGARLNELYESAQAEFRLGNGLDAKGFSRAPRKTVQPKNRIEFVPVHPSPTAPTSGEHPVV